MTVSWGAVRVRCDHKAQRKRPAPVLAAHQACLHHSGWHRRRRGRTLQNATLVLGMSLLLSFAQFAVGAIGSAWAASPLNVFVGYMDTHSVLSSSKQPNPWPYTDPSSFHGSPCPNFPKDTTCWDASAVRLDNPGSADVTAVK